MAFGSKIFVVGLMVVICSVSLQAQTQKRTSSKKTTPKPVAKVSERDRLRDEYLKITKEYKASLEKLLGLYEVSQTKAEQKHVQSKRLFEDGLISKSQLEESEQAIAAAKGKVDGVKFQISTVGVQTAQALIELEGDKEIAKMGRMPKGSLVRSTAFIRFNAGSWSITNAEKVQKFFSETFRRPLPIAVFGQGAIHDRWRLDHRNAMDVSVIPDTPEGQALMEYLRASGVPFSAFRMAIPNVATGPHIHIGLPSHRY